MPAPIPLRSDFDAALLRKLASGSRDPDQTRRLLAQAEIYDGGWGRPYGQLSWSPGYLSRHPSVLTLNCHHIIHAASALSRATRARLILERILAPSPQQNDVGAFLVSRADGGRPRPATKFFRDIPLRVQSLDGPRHPSNPPPNQIARQILVDICDPGH